MSTFMKIGERGNDSEQIVSGIDDFFKREVGDSQYEALLAENAAEVDDSINRYLGMFGGKIRGVMLEVNDYRESLGLGLVSVSMQALNENGDEVLLGDESKAPTIGFAEPVYKGAEDEEGLRTVVAGFQVADGVTERITALSEILFFNDALGGSYLQREFGPMNVPSGECVAAELALLDEEVLEASGIPYEEGLHEDGIPGQVYFCRYLTAKAANDVVDG